MGWFGNAFILFGVYLIGNKNKLGFVFAGVGEVIWSGYAIHKSNFDLASLSFVFIVMNIYNYLKWRKNDCCSV
jgi:hypothetical protein